MQSMTLFHLATSHLPSANTVNVTGNEIEMMLLSEHPGPTCQLWNQVRSTRFLPLGFPAQTSEPQRR